MILIVNNCSAYIEELCACVKDYEVKLYNEVNKLEYDAVILSGRVKNDKNMNLKNINIIKECYRKNIPLLGICYGAEIISLTFGGLIRRLEKKVYGMTNVYLDDNILIDKKSIEVFENHQYAISKIPYNFRSIGYTPTNNNEIITNGIIYATQFHPELSKDGRDLINQFINLSKRYVSNQR
ncbi:MAG: gamma-glutamyl-gamma-aminobutyrate hydrolase family protein [Candidatus Nitrosocaldaceae archaeon]